MGKKTEITIDFMRKEDIEQVMAIEQDSFSVPWSRNLFLSEFRSPGISTLMVALSDASARTIIAYIIFWHVGDEMHILNLAVTPSERRQGIATRLVLAAIKRAYQMGARRAYLEVRVSNEAAMKLYSDLGFTGISVRRDYYDAPVEDAVVMALAEGAFISLAMAV
ncbi:MAG TPA: ribosomal protein S18-alanine N-acetyltransferase [Nitrospirota bacterium]|nr:ribosomal protein S18-alanine N-acetyltransferase [Nitrospirota bacterium]